MLHRNSRSYLLAATSILVMATTGAQTAQAQAQEQAASVLEEITVTGSRIQRTSGMTTPTPVTALTADELTAMAPGSLAEALAQLPQFYSSTTLNNPGGFFGSPGAGSLNMRGIGTNRTLVLLDGRRVVSSSRLGGSDINFFPEAMVKSVESVTGGASAAYGTDAVAGVVNFILDTEFEGLKAHMQGGTTSRGDNKNWEASVSFGTSIGDKMHLLVSADYYKQNGVFTYEGRDWYQAWGRVGNPEYAATGLGPEELILPNVVSTRATFGGVIDAPGSALDRLHFLQDGTATPFILGDTASVNGTRSHSILNGGSGDYVGADAPNLASDAERGNVFMYLDYDISDNVTIFAQGIAGKTTTEQLNLGGVFQSSYAFTIYQENAFLPDDLRQIMVDEGLESFTLQRIASHSDLARHSTTEQDNKTLSGTLGLKANIEKEGMFDGWRVNAYYQIGRTQARGRQKGAMRIDRVYAAADAVVDPTTGSVVCQATLIDPDNFSNCVPVNLFGNGAPSDQAVEYLSGFDVGQHITSPVYFTADGFDSGETIDYITDGAKTNRANVTQHVAEFSMDGEVWKGWGAGPIAMAFGASYREDRLHQTIEDVTNPSSDPTVRPINIDVVRGVPRSARSKSNGVQYSTVPNIVGKVTVKEVFSEAIVPLLSGVTGAQNLTATMAVRWADYSGSGSIWSWKAGLDWQIFEDLRLRGTVSRDVRAGSLSERYDLTGGLATFQDPEFGNAFFDSPRRAGGNPNVSPEKADTITIGAVYQPSWLDGLSMSIDWYQIDIKGAIGQLGVQRIIDECYAGAVDLCAQITRDSITNEINLVQDVFLNIDEARARGIDAEISYVTDVTLFGGGDEMISARVFGSWLDENSITLNGVPKRERAGSTGGIGGLSLPDYKITAGLTYNNGPVSFFVQERYISSGVLDYALIGGVDVDDASVDSAYYTDLRLAYTIDRGNGSTWEIFANVTNLFDRDPPITASFSTFTGSATQTNPGLFDVLGRRFVGGVRLRY